uniref:Akirin n=1 Tax=Mesocestoides corti TaxID=53468 RepID=A0A5K3FRZ9_MESCO
MACVALKRSAAFEIIGPSSPKRHRCSSSLPCNCQLPAQESAFTPSTKISKSQIHRRIREEVLRLQRRRVIPKFPIHCLPTNIEAPDVYNDRPSSPEESSPPACSQVISSMRHMAIRSPKADSEASSDSDEGCEASTSPPQSRPASSVAALAQASSKIASSVASGATHASHDTVPLFTLCQVTALCDRLIREREDQLREEYDNILSCKLAEQYEALLKFNQDQLSHRFKDTPMSYVS